MKKLRINSKKNNYKAASAVRSEREKGNPKTAIQRGCKRALREFYRALSRGGVKIMSPPQRCRPLSGCAI